MPEQQSRLQGVALVAALIVIAAWLAMLFLMIVRVDDPEIRWARLGQVLGSIEAVAFAAAGALFGTTVQAKRVQEATARAEGAEERADRAEATAHAKADDAAKGRALAEAIKARGAPRGATERGAVERVSRGGDAGGGVVDDTLLALATRLFPD
jgi:hypothetical protein